jgi:hypothetical protein
VGQPIGQVCDVNVGFATLKDKVFFVDEAEEGVEGRTTDGRTMRLEREVTRPAYRVADLVSEQDIQCNRRRIIFPYRKDRKTHRFALIPEAELGSSYPRTMAYLLDWKPELLARDKGEVPPDQWFAWGRSQALESPGPKLVTKTFNRFPQFFLDHTDQLFCNGYSVRPKASDLFSGAIDIRLLQRILNSAVFHYYVKLTSFQIEGDYQCYQKNFFVQFTLPVARKDITLALDRAEPKDFNQLLCEFYGISFVHIQQYLHRANT